MNMLAYFYKPISYLDRHLFVKYLAKDFAYINFASINFGIWLSHKGLNMVFTYARQILYDFNKFPCTKC